MSNRELATIIIVSVAIIAAMFSSSVRSSLASVLKSFLSPKILVPLLVYAAGLAGFVWLAARLGLWTGDLLSSTLFWFVLSGSAWFIHVSEAAEDPDYFSKRLRDTVTVAAFFEFFINFESFSLVWELVLQAGFLVLGGLRAVAGTKDEYRQVRRAVDGLLSLIVLVIAIYTVKVIVDTWSMIDVSLLVQSMLLPIWLTAVSVPFIFVIALYSGYELLLVKASILNERHRPNLKVIAGLTVGLRFKLLDINGFGGNVLREAVRSGSFGAARREISRFKHDRQIDHEDRAAARQRLVDFAGQDGVDERGRRLDRREFAETKEALQWLATCHTGWYRQKGKYRADLMEVLQDFMHQGLPPGHGIVMRVRPDGQAWYAYRRTVSGWVFGIGARDKPPDQWFFDGEPEPRHLPSHRAGWTDLMSATRTEWLSEGPI